MVIEGARLPLDVVAGSSAMKTDMRMQACREPNIEVPKYRYPVEDNNYDQLTADIRTLVLEMSHRAKAPHLASALSCVELLAGLYGSILRIDPLKPMDPERDRFIFSKGHAASVLYATLALFGFFPESDLLCYGQDGGTLGEQPSPYGRPGVEAATGSLGHGLPLGVGMAKAAKINKLSYQTFVLMSDGECNEGSVWEAALMAPAQGLDNLVVIIDFNKWQATGRSEEVTALSPLAQKWSSFGWNAHEIDGHNIGEVISAIKSLPNISEKPTAIIAHTVKGRGVSFMEDDNNWHYRIPTDEELRAAKEELIRQ